MVERQRNISPNPQVKDSQTTSILEKVQILKSLSEKLENEAHDLIAGQTTDLTRSTPTWKRAMELNVQATLTRVQIIVMTE